MLILISSVVWICALLVYSFPRICLLCILIPPLEGARSAEDSAPFSLLGLAFCSQEVFFIIPDESQWISHEKSLKSFLWVIIPRPSELFGMGEVGDVFL